jgi:hypothetical protein
MQAPRKDPGDRIRISFHARLAFTCSTTQQFEERGTVTCVTFCKTSKAAKIEKMESPRTTVVNKARKDIFNRVVDKEMAGMSGSKKMGKYRCISQKVVIAINKATRHAALRSPPTHLSKGPTNADWTRNAKTC